MEEIKEGKLLRTTEVDLATFIVQKREELMMLDMQINNAQANKDRLLESLKALVVEVKGEDVLTTLEKKVVEVPVEELLEEPIINEEIITP